MTSHILDVSNVAVHFGGIKALDGVSFGVERGSVTAIIGPNGAGKTTLFNCITGFYKASAGTITYHERTGNNVQSHDLSKRLNSWFGGSHMVANLGIARTFQNIRLFDDMSVIENLLVAQHNHINRNLVAGILNLKSYRQAESSAMEKAYYWLTFMNLTSGANRLAKELPYGDQRRLEIARAMCTNPTLICLDEPAAGLNHQETKELSKLISTLREHHQMTVLVIEHDMALVMEVSDHIVVLDHGEVIAKGSPSAIRSDPKVLAAYLGDESP